jgi:hypothetical protein
LHGLHSEGAESIDTAKGVLAAARSMFGGCAAVSLTTVGRLGAGRELYFTRDSVGVAIVLDVFQYHAGEGPCVEAVQLNTAGPIYADDLASRRARLAWPRLARYADGLGIRSALSISVPWDPMLAGPNAEQHALAAINFYAPEPSAFEQSEQYKTLFGCWAGAVMSHKQPGEVLRAGYDRELPPNSAH